MSPRVYGPRRGHSLGPGLWNQGLQRTMPQDVSKAEASQPIFPTFKEEGHTHCSQWDPRVTVVSFPFPFSQGDKYILAFQNDSLWQCLARYSPNSLIFHGHTTATQERWLRNKPSKDQYLTVTGGEPLTLGLSFQLTGLVRNVPGFWNRCDGSQEKTEQRD